MEDNYTGGDICIDCSTDCIGNDIVYGSRTDIHLKRESLDRVVGAYFEIRDTRKSDFIPVATNPNKLKPWG